MKQARGRKPSPVASTMDRWVARASVVAAFAWMTGPGAAWAASSATDVEAAEQAYVNLDYADAHKLAEAVVRRRGLNHDELVRAYRVMALSAAVLDKTSAAKAAFIQLLTYDPGYHVDANLAPKVQSTFFEALGYWRAQPTKPGVEAVASVHPPRGGSLRVTTRDPTHITRRIIVGYRWNAGSWSTADVYPDEAVIEIPAPPAGATRFDYYVQALDNREDEVFVLGSEASPKVVVVDPQSVPVVPVEAPGHSVFKSPVFWTITGLVLAGAGAGIALAILNKPTVTTTVPATAGTLTPTLTCNGGPC